jgi:hypothetical protein
MVRIFLYVSVERRITTENIIFIFFFKKKKCCRYTIKVKRLAYRSLKPLVGVSIGEYGSPTAVRRAGL